MLPTSEAQVVIVVFMAALLCACMGGGDALQLVANPGKKTIRLSRPMPYALPPAAHIAGAGTASHNISCVSLGIAPRCSVWPTEAGQGRDPAYRACMARNGYALR